METGREKSRKVNVLVIKGEERGSPASEVLQVEVRAQLAEEVIGSCLWRELF